MAYVDRFVKTKKIVFGAGDESAADGRSGRRPVRGWRFGFLGSQPAPAVPTQTPATWEGEGPSTVRPNRSPGFVSRELLAFRNPTRVSLTR